MRSTVRGRYASLGSLSIKMLQHITLTEQTKELSALGQKIAGESAEPITRGVNQAFKNAS
jgi:hypothetical protein